MQDSEDEEIDWRDPPAEVINEIQRAAEETDEHEGATEDTADETDQLPDREQRLDPGLTRARGRYGSIGIYECDNCGRTIPMPMRGVQGDSKRPNPLRYFERHCRSCDRIEVFDRREVYRYTRQKWREVLEEYVE